MKRRTLGTLLLAVCSLPFYLLGSCRSPTQESRASIEIVATPAARIGGPERLQELTGIVKHAQAGQQVVLYAHSGVWWIQPFANQPFTRIQPDSSWKSMTHLGSEYAALLVDAGYRPFPKLLNAPQPGEGIAAIAIAKGRVDSSSNPHKIQFSGYEWTAREAGSDHGGEPNDYDPANAWTDQSGYLHLRMNNRNGHWTCAEVSLDRSLGYGTYRFEVQDVSHLRDSAVFSAFTWDDSRSENFHDELDIEVSRWGDPKIANAEYVIQPFYVPENFIRFAAPPGSLTYELRWYPGTAAFETRNKWLAEAKSQPVSRHQFTANVPTPASETLHFDLYDFHHTDRSLQAPAEVIVKRFEYVP